MNSDEVELIIGELPVILFQLDMDGIFKLSVGNGLKALNLKPNEVRGLSAYEIYKDLPEVTDGIRHVLSGKSFTYQAKVGEIIFRTIYTPIRDRNNSLIGVVGLATNVTDEVNALEKLKQMNTSMIGRELKMVALKEENEKLKQEVARLKA